MVDGVDATIITYGIMVWPSLQAAEQLKKDGILIRVLNMHTIKPIDQNAVIQAVHDTGAIVTVENANYLNGLGSAVAELISELDLLAPLRRVGIKDEFGEVGTLSYLMERFHLTPDDITTAVKDVVSRKRFNR